MDLVLGYAAGLLTLINPCVLPVLPIVLATALQAGRGGPLALAGGMSLSFVALGLGVAALGQSLGLTEETVSDAAAVLMVVFGLVMLVPRFGAVFATATAGAASRADAGLDRVDRSGLQGQFVGGLLLGAVWSPCIGPTLGGAISLASQGENLVRAAAIGGRQLRRAVERAVEGAGPGFFSPTALPQLWRRFQSRSTSSSRV